MTLQGLRRSLSWLRRTPLHPQWLLDSRESVERWAAPHVEGVVLDIGCGDRWLEPLVAGRGQYVGLDSLATGAALYGARPSLFGDAASLPFPDRSIDCVVLLEVLEHLEHPREALREIARVLKPGGRLLLSMPFLYPIHDAPHDFQRYTTHGLAREMTAVGFEVRSIDPTRHAFQAAGLLVTISCAGVAIEAFRRRSPALVLVPFVLVTIPIVNTVAWVAARLLPDWPALTSGYRVLASRRA
jgi:SAM-dependent methyltransferase